MSSRAISRSSSRPMASTTLGAYSELVRVGFGAFEATQMTALAFGLSVHDCRWTIDQINSVLFLAELRRRGHFGPRDGDHRSDGRP
jgi:hypothetical protein